MTTFHLFILMLFMVASCSLYFIYEMCSAWMHWICQNNRLIGGIVVKQMCEKMLHGMVWWDWIDGILWWNKSFKSQHKILTTRYFSCLFFNSIFIIERLLMNSNRLLIIILFLQQTNNHKRSISISIPCVVCIIISEIYIIYNGLCCIMCE